MYWIIEISSTIFHFKNYGLMFLSHWNRDKNIGNVCMGLKWKDLLEKLPTITSAKIDPFIQKESFIDIKVMPHITSLKYHVIPKPIVSGCSTECIRDHHL